MIPRDRSNGFNGYRDQTVILEAILIKYAIYFSSGMTNGDWKQKYDTLNQSFIKLQKELKDFQEETTVKLANIKSESDKRLQDFKNQVIILAQKYA